MSIPPAGQRRKAEIASERSFIAFCEEMIRAGDVNMAHWKEGIRHSLDIIEDLERMTAKQYAQFERDVIKMAMGSDAL